MADEMASPNAPARLSDNERLALRVNGRFSLVDRDAFVWQRPALAITFRPNWGPQATPPLLSQFQFDDAEMPTLGPPRTIYLLFDTPAERQQVWATLVGDSCR